MLIRSSLGSSRRAATTGLSRSTTFCGSVPTACRISRACSTGTPKLPVMVSTGMAAQKSTLSSACPSCTKPVDEQVHGLGDPIVDPPFAVRRQERRLDEGAITLVLLAAHREHAVGQTQWTALEIDGLRRRGEHIRVAVDGHAGVVVEHREMGAVGVRQPVEEQRVGGAGQLVENAGQHRPLFAQPVPNRVRIVLIGATGVRVVGTSQVEQLPQSIAIQRG